MFRFQLALPLGGVQLPAVLKRFLQTVAIQLIGSLQTQWAHFRRTRRISRVPVLLWPVVPPGSGRPPCLPLTCVRQHAWPNQLDWQHQHRRKHRHPAALRRYPLCPCPQRCAAESSAGGWQHWHHTWHATDQQRGQQFGSPQSEVHWSPDGPASMHRPVLSVATGRRADGHPKSHDATACTSGVVCPVHWDPHQYAALQGWLQGLLVGRLHPGWGKWLFGEIHFLQAGNPGRHSNLNGLSHRMPSLPFCSFDRREPTQHC